MVPMMDADTGEHRLDAPINLPIITTFALQKMLDEAKKEFPMITHITYGVDHPIPREATETKTDTFVNAEDVEHWLLKWLGGDTK